MYKSGYSVLLLTIIISVIGVTLAISALSNSTQIAKTNINITDAVLDKAKASSCVEKVFAKLRSYKYYGGDETFEDGCRVYTISGIGNSERIIHTKVDFTILETKIIQIQPTVVIDYQKQISNEELTQNQVNNPYLIDPLALRLWLKADRAEVNNGQSVLSVKNATNDLINFAQRGDQSNFAPRLITNAINNRPALRFDGVDDFLTSTTTSIHTNAGLSVIVVGKANSTGNNQTYIGKFDATNNEREWRLQNDDFIATDLATAETANETVSFANNTNVRIISATWAPNQLASVNLNSDNAINATSPVVADISNTTEPIIVGANAQGGTSFLNGDIAEILVYNKKLSTEELNKIRTYLNTKYIPPTPTIVQNGLVLNLDAGNTSSYPGTGTTWTDLSGNNNNGTLVNGVGYNSANGGSLVFDGVDDYINLGSFFNYQNFTISLWVYPGTTQVQYADIFDNNHTGSRNFVLQQNNTNVNQYGFGVFDGSGCISCSSDITLAANTWTHLSYTFTPSDRVITYLNGQMYSQGPLANNRNILYQSQNLSIARWSAGGRHWNGRISNFSVYNRVLTDSEIQQNYNATKGRFGL